MVTLKMKRGSVFSFAHIPDDEFIVVSSGEHYVEFMQMDADPALFCCMGHPHPSVVKVKGFKPLLAREMYDAKLLDTYRHDISRKAAKKAMLKSDSWIYRSGGYTYESP